MPDSIEMEAIDRLILAIERGDDEDTKAEVLDQGADDAVGRLIADRVSALCPKEPSCVHVGWRVKKPHRFRTVCDPNYRLLSDADDLEAGAEGEGSP